jgi:hypothetical protein
MGAVSARLFTGVMEAVTVPVCAGGEESVAGAMVMLKSGVVPLVASARGRRQRRARWVASPL